MDDEEASMIRQALRSTTAVVASVAGGADVLDHSGAPWWIVVAIIVTPITAAIVAVVRHVFPQESRDRLEWWRDRRRRK
jgi:hypothetical protein